MATQDLGILSVHSEKLICSNKPSVLFLNKDFTYNSWLEFLNRNGSKWARDNLNVKYSLTKDYDMISWTYQCFIEGLQERKEKTDPQLYYMVGYYKYMQVNDDLPLEQMHQLYEGKILATGQWYKKAVEAGYSKENIKEGKWCIHYYEDYEQKRISKGTSSNKDSEGCYIATAVYGSYDCPEVWTLR